MLTYLWLLPYHWLWNKWGVPLIWDFIVSHFLVNLSKNHDFCQNKEKQGPALCRSLLKGGNLLWLTSFMLLIIIVQKSWFLSKMKKNSDLPYAYCVKGWQPIYNYCIYATDYEMECYLNLRLDLGHFGSICPKIMIFAKIKKN